MRTTHIITTTLAALALAGCRQDVPQTKTIDPRNLRFEVAVAGPHNGDGTGTRAVKTGWDEGDQIVVHFDGNEDNTLWLRCNAAGEWETTSVSVVALNPMEGSAQALHSTFLAPGGNPGEIVADGAQVFTDSGSYLVAAGTVYVRLTIDRRITSRVTVEGLSDPADWVLAGPGLHVGTPILPGSWSGSWGATLASSFVASDIGSGIYARGLAMPWEDEGTTSFMVIDRGASEGTTFELKNLATGKIYRRTFASGQLGSGMAVVIRGPENDDLSAWNDLTPETITAWPTDPAGLAFGSVYERYASAPEARQVVITNTGVVAVTLNQPTATTGYEIGALSKVTLAPGESATMTVSPKAGLTPGDYNEPITITGNGPAEATVDASFTVMPLAPVIPTELGNITIPVAETTDNTARREDYAANGFECTSVVWYAGAETATFTKFAYNTTYKAVVTLAAKTGYMFDPIADSEGVKGFAVGGKSATFESFSGGSLVISIEFDKTDPVPGNGIGYEPPKENKW